MLDLKDIDPATVKAGWETDALIAEWRGWELDSTRTTFKVPGKSWEPIRSWTPTTNHAHAVKALLKVQRVDLHFTRSEVSCHLLDSMGRYERDVAGRCRFIEVTGSTEEEIKGKALALAICRAILAAMKAEEAKKEM